MPGEALRSAGAPGRRGRRPRSRRRRRAHQTKRRPGSVDQAHDLGALAVVAAVGGNVGDQRQRRGVEHPDAARLVVRDRDQPAVVGDGAADRVAGLDDALRRSALEQIDLGEPAVAAEHVGVAAVAAEHDRGVAEVAQALDPAERGPVRGLDDLHRARSRARRRGRDRRCRAAQRRPRAASGSDQGEPGQRRRLMAVTPCFSRARQPSRLGRR